MSNSSLASAVCLIIALLLLFLYLILNSSVSSPSLPLHPTKRILNSSSSSSSPRREKRGDYKKSDFFSHLQDRFQSSFDNSCKKYPFVEKFREVSNEKFLVFVLHDPKDGDNLGVGGGWGDNVAGIITATMAATKLDRTLIIQSRDLFSTRFTIWGVGHDNEKREVAYTRYLELEKDPENVQERMTRCINRCVGWCSFNEAETNDTNFPIIKYRSNRANLCVWTNKRDKKYFWDLDSLGVTSESDLIEVAGCLSRLALWPTPLLWSELKTSLGGYASKDMNHLIGAHFRCGDPGFLEGNKGLEDLSVICASKDQDHMADTPIELGNCAHQQLELISGGDDNDDASKTALFVATDHQMAKEQLTAAANWTNIITFSGECMYQGGLCASQNAVHWFMLSFAEKVIARTISHVLLHSAFSRTAGMYGLYPSVYVDAKRCGIPINNTDQGRRGNGNWICESRLCS